MRGRRRFRRWRNCARGRRTTDFAGRACCSGRRRRPPALRAVRPLRRGSVRRRPYPTPRRYGSCGRSSRPALRPAGRIWQELPLLDHLGVGITTPERSTWAKVSGVLCEREMAIKGCACRSATSGSRRAPLFDFVEGVGGVGAGFDPRRAHRSRSPGRRSK